MTQKYVILFIKPFCFYFLCRNAHNVGFHVAMVSLGLKIFAEWGGFAPVLRVLKLRVPQYFPIRSVKTAPRCCFSRVSLFVVTGLALIEEALRV